MLNSELILLCITITMFYFIQVRYPYPSENTCSDHQAGMETQPVLKSRTSFLAKSRSHSLSLRILIPSSRPHLLIFSSRSNILITTQRLHLRILHVLQALMLHLPRRARQCREIFARVEHRLSHDRKRDHCALENNELEFNAHEFAAPTT
jgi:hypothetical protein